MTITNASTESQVPLRILMPSMGANAVNGINIGKAADATGGAGIPQN